MNRLNALGFSKQGAPMVIDQAYELVAAEEGYRNQHALRAQLEREVVPSTQQAHFDWRSLIDRQGWNEASQLHHALGFLVKQGLMPDFVAYAEAAAAEENASPDEGCRRETVEVLASIGYAVQESEFGQPYWEFDGDASVDFADEDEAWSDAWKEAQSRAVAKHRMERVTWDAMPLEARLALVKAALAKSPEDRLREAAEQAYEAYDFGATVVGDSGWEYSTGSNVLARTVFLENTDPQAPSVRARFSVAVVDGVVRDSYLSCGD